MSPAALVGAAYALVAVIAAGIAMRRRASVGAWSDARAWALVGVLWPFLLPGLVAAPPAVSRPAQGPHAGRLAALSSALGVALDDPATAALLARPRAEIEDALQRLEQEARRLEALDRAIDGALPTARPRLEALRAKAEGQLAERLQLLEEVAAQLTVLRFVDLSAPEGARDEKLRVETLLAQLDALVELGRS